MSAFFADPSWVALHIGDNLRFIRPAESHHAFGAGFLLIGAMMSAETLTGRVWHRSQVRSLMFPATLVMLGWGMMIVTAVEPNARIVHLSMGVPMIAGGWAEARSRLDGFPRRYADLFIVPGLVLASLDTVFYHLNGPPTNPVLITHVCLAIVAVTIGGLRLYQSASPQSLTRGLMVSAGVLAVGCSLWIDAFFQ
ncbi:MAG TPA: hypothetical protein VJB57_08250 [Dehalococcoidia bacterium]|nr:hypothetical protein [Dehalococcoidia bacterium]